jgi:predicted alpha/beta superfamily hydrolase
MFMHAQYRVTLRIAQLPSYHNKSENIFIAGSFNNWNPRQKESQLENQNGNYSISLAASAGKLEFKLTRGSWDKVESADKGFAINNRILKLVSDTIINISIEHWLDHFPKAARKSTANKNVKIIDTAFYIPQLNRYRRIWIYLPETYATSRKKYPVLYMHDGQNVFDEATSGFGEWGVDEAMDTLGLKYGESIIVAIDNSETRRINEYSPFDMQRYGKAEGDMYVDFLAKTLKPVIDRKYRTLKDARHTFVAGSSMGGLISFYTILKYPKVFGGAGVFSPAFWIVPQLKDVIPAKAKKVKGKIYFYGGKPESESMVPDMLAVFEKMHKHSKAKMTTVIRTDGKHNEATWRQEFPLFYKWIME